MSDAGFWTSETKFELVARPTKHSFVPVAPIRTTLADKSLIDQRWNEPGLRLKGSILRIAVNKPQARGSTSLISKKA